MSRKHWIGLFTTCIYLLVVGFAEFPPRETANNSVKLLPMVKVHEEPVIPKPPSTLTYEEHTEKNKIAKAISIRYKKIDYVTAMKLVTVVYDTSKEHKLDPILVLAMIATESSFNANARSPRDARGYLQVIPKWHRDKIKGRDIWKMEVNIEVGAKILRDCYKKYNSNRNAFGCYNGATSDVDKDIYYSAVKTNLYRLNRALIASI